jgi:hypothetical protein
MKRRCIRCCGLLALASVLAMLHGCGGYGKLSGKVTYKGQAVPKATITFLCDNGQVKDATADDSGNYTVPKIPVGRARIGVKNFTQGMMDMQAQYMGKMQSGEKDSKANIQQSVESMQKQAGGGSSGTYVRLPEQAIDPEKSGISVEITGGSQQFNIEVPDYPG